MTHLYEKRKESQHRVSASLIYQRNLSGTNYYAKKLDHSFNGISFMSNYDLKPGTIVYIWRESCPQNCMGGKVCEGCRTVTLATVKWCRQPEDDKIESYWAGAKYFKHGIGY